MLNVTLGTSPSTEFPRVYEMIIYLKGEHRGEQLKVTELFLAKAKIHTFVVVGYENILIALSVIYQMQILLPLNRLQKDNSGDNKGIVFDHTEKYLLKRIISFCKSLSIISGSIVMFIAKGYSIAKRIEIVFDKRELAIKLELLSDLRLHGKIKRRTEKRTKRIDDK
uniref:Uncharacterized protein n=1 Tax=Glossina pallidipes TaxID=7398 RepID=A0A1A9ZG95_GLOPL